MQTRFSVHAQSRSYHNVWTSRIRPIVRQILFLAFIHYSLVTPLSTNGQSLAGLGKSQGNVDTSEQNSETPPPYDCTGGKKLGTVVLPLHIIEAIELAEKTLIKCANCRKVFDGKPDPLVFLRRLVKNKAIVMATKIPLPFQPVTGKFTASEEIDPDTAAAPIDMLGKAVEYPRPCLFINATKASFMAVDRPPEGYGLYGLELVQARAVAIIHELGHFTNAIQLDGMSKSGRRKSVANTDCIRRNCMPCASTYTDCPGVPKRHSHAQSKRFHSNEYLTLSAWIPLPAHRHHRRIVGTIPSSMRRSR
jgi:hypothetical protein